MNRLRNVLVPILMAGLTLAFVLLVVRQFTREGPSETTTPAADVDGGAPVTLPRDSEDRGKPTADELGAEAAEPEAIAQIRAHLKETFDFLRWDRDRYVREGPKIALMREELAEYLASLPPEAVPLLLELLERETDFSLRRFLLYGLGAIGTDEAAAGIVDYYQELIGREEDKNSEIGHTIRALGTVDSDFSFTALEHLVDTGRSMDRYRFVRELGNHSRRSDAVPLFMDLLSTDDNFQVRNMSAQALKKTRDPATARELEQMVLAEKKYPVKQTLMGALGAIGDPGSLDTLEQVATSDDNYVNRLSAINAIRHIGGPSAKAILLRIAEQDKHERVRADARRAIIKLEEEGY